MDCYQNIRIKPIAESLAKTCKEKRKAKSNLRNCKKNVLYNPLNAQKKSGIHSPMMDERETLCEALAHRSFVCD